MQNRFGFSGKGFYFSTFWLLLCKGLCWEVGGGSCKALAFGVSGGFRGVHREGTCHPNLPPALCKRSSLNVNLWGFLASVPQPRGFISWGPALRLVFGLVQISHLAFPVGFWAVSCPSVWWGAGQGALRAVKAFPGPGDE